MPGTGIFKAGKYAKKLSGLFNKGRKVVAKFKPAVEAVKTFGKKAGKKVVQKASKVLSKGKDLANKKLLSKTKVAMEKAKKAFGHKSPKKPNKKYAKASRWERYTKRKLKVSDLVMNSKDDIANPKIGPSDKKISQYINEIKKTGKISEPIEVQKLSSGKYEIVDGHHRWLAAKKMGMKKIPVKIKNYRN